MPSAVHFSSTSARAASLDVALFIDSTCFAICLLPGLDGYSNTKNALQTKNASRADSPAPEAASPSDGSSIPEYAVVVNPQLEAAEVAAYVDAFRSAPEVCEVAEIGGAWCLALRQLPIRTFCRVAGLTSSAPLDEIAAFYGETPWWVSDSAGLGPELEERGFVRDYGWMRFSRGVGPREARSDLTVVRAGPDEADDFARVMVRAYELPDWSAPLAANIVGRDRWSCYVAYDGDRPAGAGALFVDGGTGWLGFGGTVPELRGRGAQSAILATRIEDARRQGCTVVTTETGELEEGRPSGSYRNILRAGFREHGVRKNYRAP